SRLALGRREQAARDLERVSTRHAALSGMEIAAELLARDDTPWDGPGDPWFTPVQIRTNPHAVSIHITDEQSKISLAHLVRPSGEINEPLLQVFKRCFPGTTLDPEIWRDGIERWRRGPAPQRLTRDAAMKILARSGTWSRTDHRGIVPAPDASLLTVSGNGRININTAADTVLEAIGGESFRRAVTAARSEHPLPTVFDPSIRHTLPPEAASYLDVRTSFFRITISASGSFVTAHTEAILWRQSGRFTVTAYREWWS
ncbi:MAG TPA: type II secretion system protein GspK, partial [bacterium]|nr:type II secretion system protein GspK [bacterium]